MADRAERLRAIERLYDRYEPVMTEEITELSSTGVLLQHRKSGARVALLLNEDENKVFYAGFRTTPENSTGVAHIVEHTVLCGSERFPAKDPFVELAKGSLNTFLNAMTYPDKTVYPVASCNDKDFQNLMHVYLDAVFFPNIYRHEEIFWQEGWHYECSASGAQGAGGSHGADKSGAADGEELTLNGVVYNEMKGALSSPDDLIYDVISQALFPDTTYREESGGDPEVIPELSYEEFLDFHRRFYHPSNSYLYLYGDMDAAERLEFMDREYLSRFEYEPVDSEIPTQKPVTADVTGSYSVTAGEESEGEWYAYNVVTGLASDTFLMNAVQILEYVLVDAPGAPVKQALIDAGIGQDVRGMLNTDMKQPVLTFLVKNAKEGQKEEFLKILTDSMKELAENGLNKKSLLAAINFYDFRYREADFGYYPKGLIYGLGMFAGWLYGEEKPFDQLKQAEVFAKLRELAEENYFEDLIRKYILDNPHKAVVTLKPEPGRNERADAELKKKLAEKKAAMSEAEWAALKENMTRLRAYQATPSTKEELEKIPLLALSDIGREPQKLPVEEDSSDGITVLHHDIATNGIVYLRMLFDVTGVSEEEIPYLGLLSTALGYVDSEHLSYAEFASEMLLYTGGITTDVFIFTKKNNADDYSAYMEVKARVLTEQLHKAYELIEKMLLHTVFGDEKRMKEILDETVSRLSQRLVDNGNSTAVTRGLSYLSGSGRFKDQIRGVAYYRFLKELQDHFGQKKEEIFCHLNHLVQTVFTQKNALYSITAEEDGYRAAREYLPDFEGKLYRAGKTARVQLLPEKRNEGFATSGQVQYVGRLGNFAKAGCAYTGALQVLTTILGYDYLWNQVRVKGGAYGCHCGFAMDGDSYLVSYRDPKLSETEAVYEGIPAYLEGFEADDRDMLKYIIGTISNLDTPLSPMARGGKALTAWLRGLTEEDYRQERQQVLATDVKVIRALAPMLQSILQQECHCTVGNEKMVATAEGLFDWTGSLTGK